MDSIAEWNNKVRQVALSGGAIMLEGILNMPETAHGIVLCAYGSGSNEHNVRDGYLEVAQVLHKAGLATLLVNLLTPEEEALDKRTNYFHDNVSIYSQRILGATNWFILTFDTQNIQTRNFKIGCFAVGASAGGALVAAAERPDALKAVVSCSGRPDLVESYLPRVGAPTLFIVGEKDTAAVDMHRTELARLDVANRLELIPGVTHLFEESNALQEVTRLTQQWFERYLAPTPKTTINGTPPPAD